MGRQMNELPVPVIMAAMKADAGAMATVLSHFSSYIKKLSTRTLKDEYGNEYLYVDEDMRNRLEAKLICSIISEYKILPA